MCIKKIQLGKKNLNKINLNFSEKIFNFICENLVRKKVQKQFGGNLQAFISGGGALDQKIGEFLGLVKLTKSAACKLLKKYLELKKNEVKEFHSSKTLEKAYLTDMIQELVDIGIKVHCVIIERGWKEIDTVEDYQKALKEFNQ